MLTIKSFKQPLKPVAYLYVRCCVLTLYNIMLCSRLLCLVRMVLARNSDLD